MWDLQSLLPPGMSCKSAEFCKSYGLFQIISKEICPFCTNFLPPSRQTMYYQIAFKNSKIEPTWESEEIIQ